MKQHKPDGEDVPIYVKQHATMTQAERREYQKRVEEGGEVASDGLAKRIEDAHLLGYAVLSGNVVAGGALKHPTESYKNKIGDRAGYNLDGYHAELGWIYVAPSSRSRHLASRLSDALCGTYGSSIFATTRSDNRHMQTILEKLGFGKAGREYDSVEHPGKRLQLWVRPSKAGAAQ
ncbi:MAG TPA: GNAT family N-acetyltransferase [Terriglobales bacterium]